MQLLHNWLSLVCYERGFTKETFALASYYVDMFLLRERTVGKGELQLLGFSALFLAAKMEESKIPCNRGNIFRKSDVLKFERQICQALMFRLNPDTFVHSLNLLISGWEEFIAERPQFHHVRFNAPEKESYLRLRTVYDIADCINLGKWLFD